LIWPADPGGKEKFSFRISEYFMPFSLLRKIFLLSISLGFFFLLSTTPILAETYGIKETMDTAGPAGEGLIKDAPEVVVGRVIGTILSFVGVIFFVLIFYAGLRWMMAQGNEQEVEKAKQIIIASVSGLIIVLAAYAITAYIGEQLTNPG
jgi:cbb3-type cytochrome oxidase subunit 3